jgi:hypothetical protein
MPVPPLTILALGLEEAAALVLAVSLENHASGEKAGLLLPLLLSSSPWSCGFCRLFLPHHLMAICWFLCVFVEDVRRAEGTGGI